MINHHPKFELIQSYVNGDLPASLSAAITIHSEMCPQCKQLIAQLTEQTAEVSFEETLPGGFDIDDNENTENVPAFNFDKMIEGITESNEIDIQEKKVEKTIAFKDTVYKLPTVLNNMVLGKTAQIGKLARTRIQLDETEIHTNLLHIEPGGSVPEHTHKGFELTVLLEGSFHDDHDKYVKGDFIMLDSSHQHHPVSPEGCLCYTVANDALHFTQGINKLLNPIGSFIY